MVPGKRIDIGHPLVFLRRWELTDAESLARYANNRKIWRNVRDAFPHPYTLGDAAEWLEAASRCDLFFALATERESIGGIGLHPQSDVYRLSAEIGFWLGVPYWNQGIMTRAVTVLSDLAFRDFRFVRIWAQVFAWNPASARVLEKSGYEREGTLRKAVLKDGHLIDCFLYGKIAPLARPDHAFTGR
jgi:[ribosomal protein S5]-alanine N-acetyltransferase